MIIMPLTVGVFHHPNIHLYAMTIYLCAKELKVSTYFFRGLLMAFIFSAIMGQVSTIVTMFSKLGIK